MGGETLRRIGLQPAGTDHNRTRTECQRGRTTGHEGDGGSWRQSGSAGRAVSPNCWGCSTRVKWKYYFPQGVSDRSGGPTASPAMLWPQQGPTASPEICCGRSTHERMRTPKSARPTIQRQRRQRSRAASSTGLSTARRGGTNNDHRPALYRREARTTKAFQKSTSVVCLVHYQIRAETTRVVRP
jgi:hypothetical protein